MVQKHGAMIKSPNGYPVQSPYLSHLNKQTEIMMRIASEFGFTPASRSRIFSFGQANCLLLDADTQTGGTVWDAVARLVGIEGGVVSGVFNLESSGVRASDWRPRHDKRYHEA